MKKIEELAKKNNYETLLRQLTEEAGELIVAIQKYKRAQDENLEVANIIKRYLDILREIADVQICIEQLIISDDKDKIYIENVKKDKILRQLDRFKRRDENNE